MGHGGSSIGGFDTFTVTFKRYSLAAREGGGGWYSGKEEGVYKDVSWIPLLEKRCAELAGRAPPRACREKHEQRVFISCASQ
jgi:hypothetical protein